MEKEMNDYAQLEFFLNQIEHKRNCKLGLTNILNLALHLLELQQYHQNLQQQHSGEQIFLTQEQSYLQTHHLRLLPHLIVGLQNTQVIK